LDPIAEAGEFRMTNLDPLLLEVLACPSDKQPLVWLVGEQALYNPRLHLRYEVRDGIPVLLVDEAATVSDAEHERLVALADATGAPETGRGRSSP
jgi:uncharacterized protein